MLELRVFSNGYGIQVRLGRVVAKLDVFRLWGCSIGDRLRPWWQPILNARIERAKRPRYLGLDLSLGWLMGFAALLLICPKKAGRET